MTKLAASSGTVIYENENKLYVTKRPAPWTGTFLFVTGLLALTLLINGLVQLFLLDIQSRTTAPLGGILLATGIIFALIFWRITVYRKKMNALPPAALKYICIIDLTTNSLLDAQQNLLAPLTDVQLLRKMQFTSSSPQLLLTWNKNELVVVEGNPFAGGIAAVEKTLLSKGIKRK